ncbi:MAG: hypothetical protein ACYTG6_10630 [Planctomycetota bacterium]
MQSLAATNAVVTGDTAEEATDEVPASPFASLDRPVVVYVCDPSSDCDEAENLEDVVFANEKIGLAVKAFRTIKMTPEDVERDPILQDNGTSVPRLLVVDPVKERVKVLEKGRLKASTFFSTMKTIANRFYKERLDKLVKEHLKLLTERDQLSNEIKVLEDKEERAADDEAKLARIKEDRAKVEAELAELAKREREMWQLTPREQRA